MVKKMIIGYIIWFLIVATAGVIIYARDRFFVHDPTLGGMKTDIIKDLELTPDQVKSIEAIIKEFKDEIPDMRKHHQKIHEKFSRQFADNDFNQEAIKATLDKKLVELRSMTDLMISKVAEFHDILTPEQREKFVQHIKDIKGNYGGGFGPGLRHWPLPVSRLNMSRSMQVSENMRGI